MKLLHHYISDEDFDILQRKKEEDRQAKALEEAKRGRGGGLKKGLFSNMGKALKKNVVNVKLD